MKMSEPQPSVDPGDDSIVLRLYARWRDTAEEVTTGIGSPRGNVSRMAGGEWQLALAVQRGTRRQVHFISVDPDATRRDRWPLIRLAPGVWDIPVSVLVRDQLHAFITLLDVPDPAPWE